MCGKQAFRAGPFFISLAISLGVGGLSAFFTKDSMSIYRHIELPPLSPPAWVFPVVWTVLFLAMGVAAYLVFTADVLKHQKECSLALYAAQLVMNFFWPILFFNLRAYFFAFLWLCLLWALICATTVSFYRVCRAAGLLFIPYLLWVTFAGYLNAGIFLLN